VFSEILLISLPDKMADYEVWIAQFWHGINILPSVAESSVAVAVHCALVAAFLWAIATNPSRPWTIFSWKQLVRLIRIYLLFSFLSLYQQI